MSCNSANELFSTWPGDFEYRLLREKEITSTANSGRLSATLAMNIERIVPFPGWWTRYAAAHRHKVSDRTSEPASTSRGPRRRPPLEIGSTSRSIGGRVGTATACSAGAAAGKGGAGTDCSVGAVPGSRSSGATSGSERDRDVTDCAKFAALN